MSQVIVTDDNLNAKRQRTRVQEQNIEKEGAYDHWRMASLTQMRPLAALIAIASLPIVAFWMFLLSLIGISLSAFTFLLKVLGKVFGSSSK